MMHWLLITYPLLLMQAQLGSASCGYNTYLHRRQEGNETTVAVSKFGYGPTNGPTNWHGLSTENKLCATGTNQSPINIDSTVATKVNAADVLNMVILAGQEMELENLGSTVEVVATGNTTINNEAFTLKQFHFHTPSEHRLNNENFPLEMHMVHEATSQFFLHLSLVLTKTFPASDCCLLDL
jgi:carbonic anhydrase